MLDKQDILDLGWIHIAGFYYEFPIKNTIECEEYSNRPLDFRLNFVSNDRYIMIEAYERNLFDWEVCFRGPCKTKEELEYIMSIFNIKK